MEFLKKKGRRCPATGLGLESTVSRGGAAAPSPADTELLSCPPSDASATGNLGRNPFFYLGLCSAAQLNMTG